MDVTMERAERLHAETSYDKETVVARATTGPQADRARDQGLEPERKPFCVAGPKGGVRLNGACGSAKEVETDLMLESGRGTAGNSFPQNREVCIPIAQGTAQERNTMSQPPRKPEKKESKAEILARLAEWRKADLQRTPPLGGGSTGTQKLGSGTTSPGPQTDNGYP
jgi:hypothetical protein